jgi:hypothetical protein
MSLTTHPDILMVDKERNASERKRDLFENLSSTNLQTIHTVK